MHLSDLQVFWRLGDTTARVQAPIRSAKHENQFHVSAIVTHTVVSGWSDIMFNKQLFVLSRPALEQGCMAKRQQGHFV